MAAFYSALHYLDSYAALKRISFGNHVARIEWLRDQKELHIMKRKYMHLYYLSRAARYECLPLDDDLRRSEHVRSEILPVLDQVRTEITRLHNKRP